MQMNLASAPNSSISAVLVAAVSVAVISEFAISASAISISVGSVSARSITAQTKPQGLEFEKPVLQELIPQKKRMTPLNERGTSLVELLVGVLILAIVVSASVRLLASIQLNSQRIEPALESARMLHSISLLAFLGLNPIDVANVSYKLSGKTLAACDNGFSQTPALPWLQRRHQSFQLTNCALSDSEAESRLLRGELNKPLSIFVPSDTAPN